MAISELEEDLIKLREENQDLTADVGELEQEAAQLERNHAAELEHRQADFDSQV